MATYQHYLECKATGRFPADSTVRRNAAIIRSVEDDCQQIPLLRILARLGGKV